MTRASSKSQSHKVLQAEVEAHPLYPVFMSAITQAMYGKGERHGGATIPFFRQQWLSQANLHGTGFLTGQCAKKIGEAASQNLDDAEAFQREALGAIVYAGMAILHQSGQANDY